MFNKKVDCPQSVWISLCSIFIFADMGIREGAYYIEINILVLFYWNNLITLLFQAVFFSAFYAYTKYFLRNSCFFCWEGKKFDILK